VPTEKRQRQKAGHRARVEALRKVQRRRTLFRRSGIVVVVAGVVVGLVFAINGGGTTTTTTTTSTSTTTTTTTVPIPAKDVALQRQVNAIAVRAGCPPSLPSAVRPVNTLSWKTAPATVTFAGRTYYAKVATTAGTFTFKLNTQGAPENSNNFVFLAEHGFYRCVTFHRVIPGFMDQGGDPTGTGDGGPGYTVPVNEFPAPVTSGSQYRIGAVAMANSCPQGDTPAECPTTNGSQFFIVTGAQGESLPPQYTVIGQVTEGMAVVDKINAEGNPIEDDGGVPPFVTNRILSVTITST
jgi:cyclophilin family peptidyl-prolyl cis-trans isomerase